MSNFWSSCPTFSESLHLARSVPNDDPTKGKRLARFDKTILWVCETNSRTDILINGINVTERTSCTNDYYGWLSSIKDQIKSASAEFEGLGVAADGPVEVVVWSWVERTPCRIVEQKPGLKTEYERLDLQAFIGTDDELDRVESFDWNADLPEDAWTPMRLKSLDYQSSEPMVVWSSSSPVTCEEAQALLLNTLPVSWCGLSEEAQK